MCELEVVLCMNKPRLQYGDYFIVFSEEEKQRIREATLQLLGLKSEATFLNYLMCHYFKGGIYAAYITDNPRDMRNLIVDADPNKPNKNILVVVVEK